MISYDEAGWHYPDWVKIYRSYDHGIRPDPAVCLWFAIIGRMIIAFKEKTWTGNNCRGHRKGYR